MQTGLGRAVVWCLLAGALALTPPVTLEAAPLGYSAATEATTRANVTWQGSTATPVFPERITFAVTATSSADEITDIRLYYGHVAQPVRTMARVKTTPGTTVRVSHVLDTQLYYLPPGSTIEYYWSATDRSGQRVESPRQRLVYTDQHHQWRALSRDLVTVHWYEGDEALANAVLDSASRTIARLKQTVGAEPTTGVTLVIYGSYRDLAKALPPNSAEWIGGQAYPALNLIVAAIDPSTDWQREVGRMVPHELSHLVLYQATRNPYGDTPTWLDEGLAVYNQEVADSRFRRLLAEARKQGTLIPLRALNSNFPFDPDEALLSYAQSGSIAEFIVTEQGGERASALVRALREGNSYDQAVQQALGLTLEQLDADWRSWLTKQADAGPTAAFEDPILSDGDLGAIVAALLAVVVIAGLLVVGLVYGATRASRPRPPQGHA